MVTFEVNFANILDVDPRPISCMRLNERTKQLALYRGGDHGSIELWDVVHQPCLVKQIIDLELIDGKPSVESIVWAQGRLFSGGLHGFIVEHDLRTGKIRNKTAATSGPVWCLAVKPDQTQLAAGTEDGFINIFDIVDDNLIYQKVLDRQEGRVLCIDWSPCGNYIASGSIDSVRLWDVEKGHAIQRLITGRSKNKETIVWSIILMDNLTIVSGDSRGIVSFWDGRVGVLKFKLVTHKADILTLKLSQDKTQLYAAGVDPTVIIITKIANSEKWVKSHPRVMHTNDVLTLECLGNRLFSGGIDADLVMSSFPPKIVTKIPPLPQQPFIFQSEGRVLICKESSINVWRLPTSNTDLQKLLEFHTKGGSFIYSACMSPEGKSFAISTIHDIRIFKLVETEGRNQAQLTLMRLRVNDKQHVIHNTFWHLRYLNDVTLLAISADGRRAMSLSIEEDGEADVEVSECVPGPCEEENNDLTSGIDSIIISNDGNFLSVNSNNRIVIYKVDDDLSFDRVCTVPSYLARITSMNFHPNKPIIILTFSDHCIQVYDFSTCKIVFCEKIKKKFDDLLPIVGSTWVDDGNSAAIFQADSMFLLKMVHNEEPVKKSRKNVSSPKADRYYIFLKSCEKKYRYLAYVGSRNDGKDLLAVEVNPNSILEKLPATFAKKRFGA